MERITEPELMENPFAARAYADADFGLSDECFIQRLKNLLIHKGLVPNRSTIFIDLGCGPGNITEKIAKEWPHSSVIGIDGSEAMLEIANKRKFQSQDQGVRKILYSCQNVYTINTKTNNLISNAHVIVSNSLLHHLHNPKRFWQGIINNSSKNTIHLHRDLRRPSSSPQSHALQREHLPNAPMILKKDYLASLKASFTTEEILMQLKSMKIYGFTVKEVDDRYLEITN